jgi:hypothetical protein
MMRALAAVMLLGCSTTRVADRATLVAYQSQPWKIELAGRDGRVEANEPLVRGDRLEFKSRSGHLIEVPIEALQFAVVNVSHVQGAFDGLGLGLLGGVAFGAALGFALGSDPTQDPRSDCGPCSLTASGKAELLGLFFGAIGAGAGALVGAVVGHREVIEFANPQSRLPSSP